MWQLRCTLGFSISKNENPVTSSSPACSESLLKSMLLPSILIGVPVFILSASNPKETSCSVIPVLALSEILPPVNDFSPINILPFKNVPLVRMTVFE